MLYVESGLNLPRISVTERGWCYIRLVFALSMLQSKLLESKTPRGTSPNKGRPLDLTSRRMTGRTQYMLFHTRLVSFIRARRLSVQLSAHFTQAHAPLLRIEREKQKLLDKQQVSVRAIMR